MHALIQEVDEDALSVGTRPPPPPAPPKTDAVDLDAAL